MLNAGKRLKHISEKTGSRIRKVPHPKNIPWKFQPNWFNTTKTEFLDITKSGFLVRNFFCLKPCPDQQRETFHKILAQSVQLFSVSKSRTNRQLSHKFRVSMSLLHLDYNWFLNFALLLDICHTCIQRVIIYLISFISGIFIKTWWYVHI